MRFTSCSQLVCSCIAYSSDKQTSAQQKDDAKGESTQNVIKYLRGKTIKKLYAPLPHKQRVPRGCLVFLTHPPPICIFGAVPEAREELRAFWSFWWDTEMENMKLAHKVNVSFLYSL